MSVVEFESEGERYRYEPGLRVSMLVDGEWYPKIDVDHRIDALVLAAKAPLEARMAELEATEKRLCEKAARLLAELDKPIHHVSLLIGPYPRECPEHGMPSAIMPGDYCDKCWSRDSAARNAALALVKDLAKKALEVGR